MEYEVGKCQKQREYRAERERDHRISDSLIFGRPGHLSQDFKAFLEVIYERVLRHFEFR